jgi:protein-disulfide isomerase
VGDRSITVEQLDAALQIRLYELDLARYELRAHRLKRLIGATSASDPDAAVDAEILLAPPEAPRLEVERGGEAIRGPLQAPVAIVEFANFQSIHSQRMQPVLDRLLDEYGDLLSLSVRSFFPPSQVQARLAAEAVVCAAEQDAYWEYHEVLLQERAGLERSDLDAYAERLDLDLESFRKCLDGGRSSGAVEADLAEAARLGLRAAPTLFVNGIYVKAPLSYAELARVVNSELSRLQIPSPTLNARQSAGAPEAEVPTAQLPEPEVILRLPEAVLSAALEQREQLQEQLEEVDLDFEGRRLLKLTEVEPGSLYERLGLRPKDTLLLVNGNWVTNAHNPLWEVLEQRVDFTLTIMRKGIPRSFRYRVNAVGSHPTSLH